MSIDFMAARLGRVVIDVKKIIAATCAVLREITGGGSEHVARGDRV
jgi:hypothetical protein